MFNRREFARLAAATAAASTLPNSLLAQAAAPPQKKVRYAVIGLGRISMQHFMPGTRMGKYGEIAGIVSGHPDKAHKWAADYNVPEANIYTYENFDKIKDNPNIDAVYVALPNNMHAEYTIRAAQAGKHVLCEKPMANTPKECEEMIAACKKANRKLMIAYRCQFQPSYLMAKQLVKDGAIGKVEMISSSYGFNIGQNEWRTDVKMAGGGPMMDVGIYCLNAARFVLGEEPTKFSAQMSTPDANDGRFKGVEENLAWTMGFPSGAVASCVTTYGAGMPSTFKVYGSQGTIDVEGFNYDGIKLTLTKNGPGRGRIEETQADMARDPNQFLVESDYFSRCVMDNTEPGPNGAEGLRDIQCIQNIYAAAKRA